MGIGKAAADQLAEQLKDRHEAPQRQYQANRDRVALVQANKELNWTTLVTALQGAVKDFIDNSPRARERALYVTLVNANNLTIATQVQPYMKIEIVRDDPKPGLLVIVTPYMGEEDKTGGASFNYTADGFTNGEKLYTPEQFAADIFEHVTEFFGSR